MKAFLKIVILIAVVFISTSFMTVSAFGDDAMTVYFDSVKATVGDIVDVKDDKSIENIVKAKDYSIALLTPTPTKIDNSNPKIILEGAQGKPGDTILVDVKVDNITDQGISRGSFSFKTEDPCLTFIGVEPGVLGDKVKSSYLKYKGDCWTDVTISIDNYLNTVRYPLKNGDVICRLKFYIPEECNNRKVIFERYSAGAIYDYNQNFVGNAKVECGTIIIDGPKKPGIVVKAKDASGKPGENIEVDIYLYNVDSLDGFASGIFDLKLDPEKFIFKHCLAGPIVNGSSDVFTNMTSTGLKVMYSDNNNTGSYYIKESGLLCKLYFKIAENCPAGSYDLNLSTKNKFYDRNVKSLESPAFFDSKIIVEAAGSEYFGDLNKDGIIDSADHTNLRRILMGKDLVPTDDATYAKRMDVNLDGEIDTGDYMMIKRYLLGTIDKFPSGIKLN